MRIFIILRQPNQTILKAATVPLGTSCICTAFISKGLDTITNNLSDESLFYSYKVQSLVA